MRAKDPVYPFISGDVMILMNDYGNLATGAEVKLDFSGIGNAQLIEEAMKYFSYKYETKSASVTYLKVLIPAIKCFDIFATIHGVESFQDYDDRLKKLYHDYLEGYAPEGRSSYSESYKKFLLAVPRTIQRGQ